MSKRTCSIPDCGRPVYGHGWCRRCYYRWYRTGSPTVVLRPRGDDAGRFWAKVDQNGPIPSHRPDLGVCWLWTAFLGTGGYGMFGLKVGDKHRVVRAHRFAYELLVGLIPEGLHIDHLCRNRGCVNPTHLEPVTQRENNLRGESPIAKEAAKTHCPQGHPYDEANTVVEQRGHGRTARRCRICRRQYENNLRARKRAARLTQSGPQNGN